MAYDPRRHNHHSLRLKGYDYTQPGAYFVNICTYQRAQIFGQVENQTVVLSPIGRIALQCWLALPPFFAHIILDDYVVMPDHLHGIIIIQQHKDSAQAAQSHHIWRGTAPGSISAIVQNFKAISTRTINRLRTPTDAPIWQRDFYDRIIRDSAELERVRSYIVANPLRRL